MGKLVGDKYGIHRVIEPQGVLTQAALKIDNDMTKKYSNEIICDVISLNIDSASFTQIEEACGGDIEKIKEMILGIVNECGKMHWCFDVSFFMKTDCHVNHAFVEYFDFRFDSVLVHCICKINDHIFSIYENLITAEVTCSAVKCCHLRS